MNKRIGIFYFSGTGNTEAVAKMIKEEFIYQHNVELIKIEQILKDDIEINPDEYDLIGVGYPTYGCSPPQIVRNFFQALPEVKQKDMFLFQTAGEFWNMNNYGTVSGIRLLQAKGYDVFYSRIIVMPANSITRFKDEFSKQLYATAFRKVKHMCIDIENKKRRNVPKIKLFPRIFAMAAHSLESSMNLGKSLRATDECTNCGTCIELCPVNNIRENSNGEIEFDSNCESCLRCVYSCPTNAITPGILYRFLILKDGYNLQEIINNPEIGDRYITENTKGYFKHYYEYFRDIES